MHYCRDSTLKVRRMVRALYWASPAQRPSDGTFRGNEHTFVIALPNTALSSSLASADVNPLGLIAAANVYTQGTESDVAVRLAGDARVVGRIVGSELWIEVFPVASVIPSPEKTAPESSAAEEGTFEHELVPLKYADVSEIVGVLDDGQQVPPNDVFHPEGSIFSLPSSVNGNGAVVQQPTSSLPAAGEAQSVAQRIDGNVAIDRRLNAVILSGSPSKVAELKRLVNLIDVP